ncbi:MAG: hypothetical protein QOJ92_2116 [Frankiales bacterium]|nr:hypothetical protein [Frankiales bacterium]
MAGDDEEPWKLNPNITYGKEMRLMEALTLRGSRSASYHRRRKSLFLVPMLLALGFAVLIFLTAWLVG